MIEHLPAYGLDGGAVPLMRATGGWLVAVLGVVIIVLGGLLLT